MKVLVKQPTGKLGLFDADIPMFVWDGIDLVRDSQQLKAFMGHISPRLLAAEIEFAFQDVSWGGEEWASHPDGLARWERCVKLMIDHHGLDDTKTLLDEGGLGDFPLHPRSMAVAAYKDMKEEAL